MFCNDIWPLQPNELKTNKLSYLVLLLHTNTTTSYTASYAISKVY